MSNFETLNACAVSVKGDDVLVLMPRTKFSREEALMFAAWLVAMATVGDKTDDCDVASGSPPPGDICARVDAVRRT